ncbi:MAG: diguanylate cyclase [Tepidanaerobacteraceae bacterium]
MVSHKKYTYLIGALGFGLSLFFMAVLGLDNILSVKHLIFLLFMIVSEMQTVKINNSHYSMEFGFVYSAVFIFGPVSAALMKALSTLACQLYAKVKNDIDVSTEKIIFSVGQYMISFFVSVGFYLHMKKSFMWDHPLCEIMVQGGSILIYYLLNNLLIKYYLALRYNKSLLQNFPRSLLLDFSTYLLAVPAGVATVSIYNRHGFFETFLVMIIYMTVVYVYILYLNLIGTNRELAALYDMAVTITSTLDIEMVMDIVLNSVQSIAPWDTACLYVYQNGWLVPAIFEGFGKGDFKESKIKPGEQMAGCSIFKNNGVIINNCHKDQELKESTICPTGTKSILAVPLINNKELIGGIALTSKKNNIYTKKHLTLLSILASQAAVALSNAYLFDKTTQMAVTDGLTGLYNHTYLYSELERQMKNVNNTGGIFSLVIIDVDHFKVYNDMYGHIIGDIILKNLADVLKKNVRDKDTIGRYGGEEFAIILPGIPPFEAVGIAERIRRVVEKTALATVNNEKMVFITISAGVASYPTDAASVEDLINKADKAMLFGAKQKGRNKVVMFRPNMNVDN